MPTSSSTSQRPRHQSKQSTSSLSRVLQENDNRLGAGSRPRSTRYAETIDSVQSTTNASFLFGGGGGGAGMNMSRDSSTMTIPLKGGGGGGLDVGSNRSNVNPPALHRDQLVSRSDLSQSLSTFSDLMVHAKNYRNAMMQLSKATNAFAGALERCSRVKGAGCRVAGSVGGGGAGQKTQSDTEYGYECEYDNDQTPRPETRPRRSSSPSPSPTKDHQFQQPWLSGEPGSVDAVEENENTPVSDNESELGMGRQHQEEDDDEQQSSRNDGEDHAAAAGAAGAAVGGMEVNAGFAAFGGLGYMMGNHEHLMADTFYREFEIPLLETLDNYRLSVSDRQATYETSCRVLSDQIRRTEHENIKHGRRRNRDLGQFRKALAELQSQVDALDEVKYQHYKDVLEGENEVWNVVLSKVAFVMKVQLDVYDKIASKSTDPILEPLISSHPDPFGSYGHPASNHGQIFSVLAPLNVLASIPKSPTPTPPVGASLAGQMQGMRVSMDDHQKQEQQGEDAVGNEGEPRSVKKQPVEGGMEDGLGGSPSQRIPDSPFAVLNSDADYDAPQTDRGIYHDNEESP